MGQVKIYGCKKQNTLDDNRNFGKKGARGGVCKGGCLICLRNSNSEHLQLSYLKTKLLRMQ